jgi:hypothetical protein
MRKPFSPKALLAVVGAPLAVGLLLVAWVAAPAEGQSLLRPWWGVSTGARPSSLPSPGGTGQIFVTAQDVGDADADGTVAPVRIVDVLPPNLEAIGIKGIAGQNLAAGNRGPVSCALKTLECTWGSALLPAFEQIEVQIAVKV